MYLLLTSLVSVVLASCIPFRGNDPRNFQARGIKAVPHLLCQTVREEMAIVDIRVVFFRLDSSFFTACPRVVTLYSTPDIRRVVLCVHNYRAFRTVQAALQTAAAVVSSPGLVSGGNGGNSMWYSREDIRAAMLAQFAR